MRSNCGRRASASAQVSMTRPRACARVRAPASRRLRSRSIAPLIREWYAVAMRFLAGVLLMIPMVAVAEPELTPKQQVEKVIAEHMSDFRECYTKRLKTKTTLAGKVIVLITIEEKGNV